MMMDNRFKNKICFLKIGESKELENKSGKIENILFKGY